MDDSSLGMSHLGLRGKVAIVTGVSRRNGIGAAVCRAFAEHGAHILFTHWLPFDQSLGYDADEAGLAGIELDLVARGVRVHRVEMDLSLPEAPQQVIQRAVEHLGTPSILVNNAAHSASGGIGELTAAELDRHYAVNVRAMALLCAEFVRVYPGGPGGRIINLTSGQSVGPMPTELAYATSKGAIEAFTASLAPDVAARGITVNAVDPGGTDTGWMTDEVRTRLVGQMKMGRIGQPEDAARVITFLASEAGAWITGQIIHSRGA